MSLFIFREPPKPPECKGAPCNLPCDQGRSCPKEPPRGESAIYIVVALLAAVFITLFSVHLIFRMFQ